QAEDGIRYRNVTGVQTCALPIWGEGLRASVQGEERRRRRGDLGRRVDQQHPPRVPVRVRVSVVEHHLAGDLRVRRGLKRADAEVDRKSVVEGKSEEGGGGAEG